VDHDLLNIASELPCSRRKFSFGRTLKVRPTPRAQRHCAIEILLAFDGLPAAMFAKENKLVSLK
jgi:hypothetical protein